MRVSSLVVSALATLTLLACSKREPHTGDPGERARAGVASASTPAQTITSAAPAASAAAPPPNEAARCAAVFPEGFPCPEGARDAFDSPEGSRTLGIFEIDAPLDVTWRAW